MLKVTGHVSPPTSTLVRRVQAEQAADPGGSGEPPEDAAQVHVAPHESRAT